MKRTFSTYSAESVPQLRERLLAWTAAFPVCCVLDTFGYDLPHTSYDVLIGAGAARAFQPQENILPSLTEFNNSTNDWIFGHLNYNALPEQQSQSRLRNNGSGFPNIFFFVPEVVLTLKGDEFSIGVLDQTADDVYQAIVSTFPSPIKTFHAEIQQRESRSAFIKNVSALQDHIHRGDCYEINYCQEFFIESIIANPVDLYRRLVSISPNPFSAFYKLYDQYALCASPERYLKKTGNKLISQPIKGTAARVLNDPLTDEERRLELKSSEKDKTENVIIVDLVRNDLGRVCKAGSVEVEELFGIYTFPTVHQMISTIAGELAAKTDLSQVLEASFPIGSMTGAPKRRVLELIDQYEAVNRGLYAGTIGYIDPEKNYDFNVVIRTLLYNQQSGYANYFAGAGITSMSEPEQEYEECLHKASPFFRLFGEDHELQQLL